MKEKREKEKGHNLPVKEKLGWGGAFFQPLDGGRGKGYSGREKGGLAGKGEEKGRSPFEPGLHQAQKVNFS